MSRYHATQPIFKSTHKTNVQRKWIKSQSKEEIGYYDFLKGRPDKIVNYFKKHQPNWDSRLLLSIVKNSRKGIDAWQSAKYGCNAESLASDIRKILGNRVLGEKSFLNLLRNRGYIILD